MAVELLFLMLLVFLLFGPNKAPAIARQIGSVILNFRRNARDIQAQFMAMMAEAENQSAQKQTTQYESVNTTLPTTSVMASGDASASANRASAESSEVSNGTHA